MSPEVALLILRILNMLAAGLRLSHELREEYEGYTAKVRTMIEEGRGPTVAELDELLAKSDTLTERIRAAKEQKEAPIPVRVSDIDDA